MHDEAPAGHFILGWLIGGLHKQSLPAFVIALISLAYLEGDGLMLSIGLLAGFVVLAIDLAAVYAALLDAKRISRFW